MRFVFVDRVLADGPGAVIEVVKNVTATEDVFDDHFPGYPIMPGALILEVFEQASQLLIGRATGFARIGRLDGVSRATFRRFVRPGDRLQARCVRRGGAGEAWTVDAEASVDGERAASATLAFTLVHAEAAPETREEASRLRRLDETVRRAAPDARLLRASP